MNKTQREELRAIMYERYKVVAQNIFYIDHCENIETYLEKSDFFPVDWKIQTLKALKDIYIEDPIGNKILASPLNLKIITSEDREVRRHLMQNVCKFIEEKISELNTDQLNTNNKEKDDHKKNDANLKLNDVFASTSKYHYIMKVLVEKKFCQSETYIWKDEKNGYKGFLAALIKFFHKQGYLNGNKQLSTKQIQEISQNTFGIELGKDTIKKADPKDFDFNFIPPASKVS